MTDISDLTQYHPDPNGLRCPSGSANPDESQCTLFVDQLDKLVHIQTRQDEQQEQLATVRMHKAELSGIIAHVRSLYHNRWPNWIRRLFRLRSFHSIRSLEQAIVHAQHEEDAKLSAVYKQNEILQKASMQLCELAPHLWNDILRPRLPTFSPGFYRSLGGCVSGRTRLRALSRDIKALESAERTCLESVALHQKAVQEVLLSYKDAELLTDDFRSSASYLAEALFRCTALQGALAKRRGHLDACRARYRRRLKHLILLEGAPILVGYKRQNLVPPAEQELYTAVVPQRTIADRQREERRHFDKHRERRRLEHVLETAEEKVQVTEEAVKAYEASYYQRLKDNENNYPNTSRTDFDNEYLRERGKRIAAFAQASRDLDLRRQQAKQGGALDQTSNFSEKNEDGAVDTEASDRQRARLMATDHLRVERWLRNPEQYGPQVNALNYRTSVPDDECTWKARAVEMQDMDRWTTKSLGEFVKKNYKEKLERWKLECEKLREEMAASRTGWGGHRRR